jgi:dihydrofolate reductase/thymidylate synthase
MPTYHIVLCTDTHGHIGTRTSNSLLYDAPIDMQRFRTLTRPPKPNQHAVLMGRRTWASLPDQHRPLSNRINVVLTRDVDHAKHVRKAGGFPFRYTNDALAFLDGLVDLHKVFIIGGATLYNDTLLHSKASTVHHTIVNDDARKWHPASELVKVDLRAFHAWDVVEEWSTDAHCTPCSSAPANDNTTTQTLTFRTLHRHPPHSVVPHRPKTQPPTGEQQYLQLLKRLLRAPPRQTRNSITRSSFGERVVIDLSDGTVPLLTSKKMAWKTVIRELLWFVRGDTDNQKLNDEKVHIWDANASRAFLDSRGLTERAENDLGPVYGFQWRHFGAEYVDCHSDYTDQGTDQLEETRQQIANDPTNRRMLFTAWNPTDLSQMALPPCHLLGQWYVAQDDKLWLQVYQRSGDVFLGVPFNLFSYSVLVHMMAHLTKKKVGGLIHILGDAHIYENHLDVAKEQLQRPVHAPPHFRVKTTCQADTWEDFTLESFELVDYTCEGGLKASMVA